MAPSGSTRGERGNDRASAPSAVGRRRCASQTRRAPSSLVARDPADLAELLEVARIDPDPLAKSLAVQAAGAIGVEQAVLGLRDLWPLASPAERLTLVEAWARTEARAHGGEHELVRVVETASGLPALRAALFLDRPDGAAHAAAHETVLRALEQGSREERRLAINLASSSEESLIQAIVKASSDTDAQVRVAALARLSRDKPDGTKANTQLLELAARDDAVGVEARASLVNIAEKRVEPWLIKDLESPSSGRRELAALSLIDLASYCPAATALGDDTPSVRVRVACRALKH